VRITAIKGVDPETVRDGVAAILEENELDGLVDLEGRAVCIRSLRLRCVTENYYSYHNPWSRYWYADRDAGGTVWIRNYHGADRKPKRGRFLQWRDWAHLDNEINHFLDSIGVSATFQSRYGKLREGQLWHWICPMEYTV
jgi:hypothetical protein